MMARALSIPPEITAHHVSTTFESIFDNEDAMLSTAFVGSTEQTLRFVQVELPDWKGPSFEELAQSDPDRLLRLISGNTLAFHDLTFAAEAAGRIATPDAVRALLELLKHHSPLVREGAVYGLAHHVDQGWVRMRLEFFAEKDPVAGVREAAAEALSE